MKQSFSTPPQLTSDDYLRIIKEQESRLLTGPSAQYKDETQMQYLRRVECFERVVKGLIKMCQHQIGLREMRMWRGRE